MGHGGVRVPCVRFAWPLHLADNRVTTRAPLWVWTLALAFELVLVPNDYNATSAPLNLRALDLVSRGLALARSPICSGALVVSTICCVCVCSRLCIVPTRINPLRGQTIPDICRDRGFHPYQYQYQIRWDVKDGMNEV